MPYTIEISHEGAVIRCNYSGEVSVEDTLQSLQERVAMNEGKTFIHAKMLVADYTDSVVAPATSTEAVKQFAYAVKDAARINPNITFVVIMPGNLQYGLARMLDSYTHGISWQKHIVRTEAECQKLIELLV